MSIKREGDQWPTGDISKSRRLPPSCVLCNHCTTSRGAATTASLPIGPVLPHYCAITVSDEIPASPAPAYDTANDTRLACVDDVDSFLMSRTKPNRQWDHVFSGERKRTVEDGEDEDKEDKPDYLDHLIAKSSGILDISIGILETTRESRDHFRRFLSLDADLSISSSVLRGRERDIRAEFDRIDDREVKVEQLWDDVDDFVKGRPPSKPILRGRLSADDPPTQSSSTFDPRSLMRPSGAGRHKSSGSISVQANHDPFSLPKESGGLAGQGLAIEATGEEGFKVPTNRSNRHRLSYDAKAQMNANIGTFSSGIRDGSSFSHRPAHVAEDRRTADRSDESSPQRPANGTRGFTTSIIEEEKDFDSNGADEVCSVTTPPTSIQDTSSPCASPPISPDTTPTKKRVTRITSFSRHPRAMAIRSMSTSNVTSTTFSSSSPSSSSTSPFHTPSSTSAIATSLSSPDTSFDYSASPLMLQESTKNSHRHRATSLSTSASDGGSSQFMKEGLKALKKVDGTNIRGIMSVPSQNTVLTEAVAAQRHQTHRGGQAQKKVGVASTGGFGSWLGWT